MENNNIERFKSLLMAAGKGPGAAQLLEKMDRDGFFDAPCSGAHHCSYPGGLLDHSLNVYQKAIDIASALLSVDEFAEMQPSIVVASLLHDLGKMGAHGKRNYVENYLKSGKISESKPYKTNDDLLYEAHEIRSIVIASRYIDLTEEEEHAILYHNGKYDKIGYDWKETPLSMIIHFADLWCSRVTEAEEDPDA